ncbi:hypothetical protein CREGCYN_00770 [Synechococcus sp. M16CYN]
MATSVSTGMTKQGQVIGFSGATGEYNPFGCDGHGFRDLAPSQLDCSRSDEALVVLAAGGVSPMFIPIGRHRFHYLNLTGGGGLEIKGKRDVVQRTVGN